VVRVALQHEPHYAAAYRALGPDALEPGHRGGRWVYGLGPGDVLRLA